MLIDLDLIKAIVSGNGTVTDDEFVDICMWLDDNIKENK